MRYKDLKEVYADLKKIHTAPNAEIGFKNLSDFAGKWDRKYCYISRSCPDNWEQLSTFWSYRNEIRRLTYTTNLIAMFAKSDEKSTDVSLGRSTEQGSFSRNLEIAEEMDYQGAQLGG